MIKFEGFSSPRYTQVPDELFDDLLAELSGTELKVLLYIVRHTIGYKKDFDNISLSQICYGIKYRSGEIVDKGTGLSKQSAITALKNLVERGIIVANRRTTKEKGHEATTFSLHFKGNKLQDSDIPPIVDEKEKPNTLVRNLDKPPLSKNLTSPCPKIRQALVQNLDTQEIILQETILQSSSSSSLPPQDQKKEEEEKKLPKPLDGLTQNQIKQAKERCKKNGLNLLDQAKNFAAIYPEGAKQKGRTFNLFMKCIDSKEGMTALPDKKFIPCDKCKNGYLLHGDGIIWPDKKTHPCDCLKDFKATKDDFT